MASVRPSHHLSHRRDGAARPAGATLDPHHLVDMVASPHPQCQGLADLILPGRAAVVYCIVAWYVCTICMQCVFYVASYTPS